MRRRIGQVIASFSLSVIAAAVAGCSTGVNSSPYPGTLRVVLQADTVDTSIVIVKDTLYTNIHSQFNVTVFQGKAYRDSTFFTLFLTPQSYQEQDLGYNLLQPDSASRFKKYVIFDSYLPPGKYDTIQFGMLGNEMVIDQFDIPVQPNPDSSEFADVKVPFTITRGQITEVDLTVKPLDLVSRYKNSFLFTPHVSVSSVTNNAR